MIKIVDETYRQSIEEIYASYLTFAECSDTLHHGYDLFGRLRRASLNRLGVMLWYMQTAVIAARRRDRIVSMTHFANIYRRKARCAPDTNIFTARDWSKVAMPATIDYEKL